MGRPPSGSPVEYSAMEVFRVSGGKIVERWGVVDRLSMLRQIGVLPSQD